MSRHRISTKDVEQCRLTVVGNQITPSEEGVPDPSWGLQRLLAFAKSRLTASKEAEDQAILQSRKSATALFWAGCALFLIREERKSAGRGKWSEFKSEHELPATTVNDAIRLYENAKTPDALTGLGVTEAKEKFVYPYKADEDEEGAKGDSPPPQKPGRPGSKRKLNGRTERTKAGPDNEDGQGGEGREELAGEDKSAAEGSQPVIVTELNGVAQRLTEIALNDLGKLDVQAHFHAIGDALQAVTAALQRLQDEINRRLPDA